MITVHLKYEIDAEKLDDFEEYGRRWVRLVNRFGGTHHGYFLPSEGDSDIAYALFSFPSLSAYEQYRSDSMSDPECQEAFALARETRCIKRYERRFLRPLDGPPVVGVGEGRGSTLGGDLGVRQ
ncbi:NIPSNAP family protein [Streptomyces cyaneofuscatus]|uniref:NIPSNAP family protein n=1 Tax=Streptomyces cyaneofuscatus TaxID=66883 RepID=UPI0033A923A4